MWLNRFIAAALLFFSLQAFGGTKEWKAHREAARAYAKDNDLENATASYRLALGEAENAFKKADIRYLDTVLEAGWHLTQRRDFDSAIQAYERALTRLTKAIGDEVLYKVALLLALGETHLFAAKAEDSQRRFDEALQLSRSRLGPKHPFTGNAWQGLGAASVEKKDYEKALACLKEARVIAAQPELYQFEAGHRGSAFLTPRTDPSNEATVLSLTGTVYDQMERHDDAEQSYREALKALERAPGNNNPQFVTILQNLARSQTEAGRPQAALETILRALSIDDNKPGRSEAFDVSSAILGRALLGLGAEEQDRALAQLSAGGRNAPSPGSLGRVMLVAAESAVRKDAAAGASFLARLVAHVQSSTSLPNREAAALFLRAGAAARQSADLVAAEKYTKLALERLSGEASASLTPNRALIEIYTEQKKHAEAEAAHDRQIAFMKSVFGDKDSRLANALEDKAAFLESLGRAEEAKALRNEAAQVRIAAFKR